MMSTMAAPKRSWHFVARLTPRIMDWMVEDGRSIACSERRWVAGGGAVYSMGS
jgi:hypothetical protein